MPDIWMDVDTAVIVPMNIMPLIDATDFKTIEEALAYNTAGLEITWNFVTTAGVMTSTAITATTGDDHDITEPLANVGMYAIEIPASGGDVNNNTEGFGWITGKADGHLPWRGPVIGFRAAALNDALIDGGDNLDVNTIQWAGTAVGSANVLIDGAITAAKIADNAIDAGALAADCITAAKIADDAIGDEHWNVTAVAGCAVTSIANNAITAASINADAITAAKIADDAISSEHINTGAITADAFAADAIVAATLATGAITADAFAADAIVAATLATGAITADAFAADAIVAATLATGALTADAFAANAITNAAVADDVDVNTKTITAGAIAAATFNADADAEIAAMVWNAATASYGSAGSYGEALEAVGAAADPWLTNLPGAYGAGTAGYIIGTGSTLTASAIADAVWDEAATGHTDAGKAGAQLWTDIDAILDDTDLIDDGTSGLAKIATDVAAILVDTATIDTAGEIAAAVWSADATTYQTQGTFGQAIGDPAADTGSIYKAVVTDAGLATVGLDVVEVLTRLPDATAGQAGGLLIAGSNAGTTTFAALTVSGVTTLTGQVNLGGALVITGGLTVVGATYFASSFTFGDHSTANTLAKYLDDIVADTNELQTDDTPGTLTVLGNLIIALDVVADSILEDTAVIGAAGAGLTALAPASTALSSAVWTNTKAGYIDMAIGDVPTAAEIKTAIEAAGGSLALILEDTGTTIPGTITTLHTLVTYIAPPLIGTIDDAGTGTETYELEIPALSVDVTVTYTVDETGNRTVVAIT